jgi:hypothetical protein
VKEAINGFGSEENKERKTKKGKTVVVEGVLIVSRIVSGSSRQKLRLTRRKKRRKIWQS